MMSHLGRHGTGFLAKARATCSISARGYLRWRASSAASASQDRLLARMPAHKMLLLLVAKRPPPLAPFARRLRHVVSPWRREPAPDRFISLFSPPLSALLQAILILHLSKRWQRITHLKYTPYRLLLRSGQKARRLTYH